MLIFKNIRKVFLYNLKDVETYTDFEKIFNIIRIFISYINYRDSYFKVKVGISLKS